MQSESIYKSATGAAAILDYYAKILAAWPVPAEHLSVATRHGDTFVIASGEPSAPPLVLLHGTASNSATWMGDVGAYSRRFRVFAVDIPGEPGKSSPERFSWDGLAFTDWLDDVLDGLGLSRVFLGGMSLGGWATLQYAVRRPERVLAAVLICPSGIYAPRLSFIVRMVGYSMLGERGRSKLAAAMFAGAPVSEEVTNFMTLVDKNFRYRAGSPPIFTDEELHSLTMPVLYVAGSHDIILNTEQSAARLEQLVPDLTIHISESAGHAVTDAGPTVLAFLTGCMEAA